MVFYKAHETHNTRADFFNDYDVLQAVKHFASAWRQITKKNSRAVWSPLLLRKETYESPVNDVIEDVVDLGQQVGIENFNAGDIMRA